MNWPVQVLAMQLATFVNGDDALARRHGISEAVEQLTQRRGSYHFRMLTAQPR
jgi:hypothetical protein